MIISDLKNTKIPVMFLHGDDDKDVPLKFTKKTYSACASDKEFVEVKGAGHTLCYINGGQELSEKINKFIEKSINRINTGE